MPIKSEIVPSASGKTKELLILLHGYGSNGQDLISLVPDLQQDLPNCTFVSLEAMHKCELGTGYQWFSIADRGEEKMTKGARAAFSELSPFIDSLKDKYDISDNKIGVLGFSQGAMLALFTMLRRDNACAGVLAYSGALVGAPLLKAELKSKPPVMLIHGDCDDVVAPHYMQDAQNVLKNCNISVQSHMMPFLAHGIDSKGINTGRDFFKSCFKYKN